MKRLLLLLAALLVATPLFAQNGVSVVQWATFPVDTNSGNKSTGTLRVVLATDQPSLTTTWQIDWTKIGGTTISVNNGTTDAGTLRVTLSSDSTGQVKLATGANTIGALSANQSVNVAQLAGTATDVNSGNKSAGTLRVVLATDQPALTNKLLVTPDSVALPANQSVNVAQMNGVATTMGNGVAGTGVQRVAVASDNTFFEITPVATATTTNGVITTNCYITSAASTNSTNCKASAGNVYFVHVTNTTTTNYFLRLYNSSSAPTCSSATGFVETIPALGASANGGVNGRVNMIPQSYTTGIGFCLTGGGSSTDNTNAATGVYVTIGYK